MDSSIELILVPGIAAGHLVPAVEMAKVLVKTDSHVSVTVLLAKLPDGYDSGGNTTAESLSRSTASDRVKFVDLPKDSLPAGTNFLTFLSTFYESQRHHVRDAVAKISSSGSARVAGFVLDMSCTAMIDVADELGVPSYVFYTCGAGLHCLTTHLLPYGETTEIEDELAVPGFANPVPRTALPALALDKAWAHLFYDIGRGIKRSKGVLINSFEDLEPGMFRALSSSDFPPAYPVGPLINVTPGESDGRWARSEKAAEIMEWLDGQPASSVVFLCFGSMGCFDGDQVREIATALERTGVQFLWSIRRPAEKADMATPTPTEYENPSEVLPEGFMERTAGIGKVVGWAPQVAVLGHAAVGGFVSHCGWNSVLESVWFGVPVATFPLYAEQHFNAFEMVKELGLSVEICMSNERDILVKKGLEDGSGESVVKAEKIEMGIVKLMERDSEVRKKVKEMSQKSKKALLHGGSSYNSLSRFINEVME